MLFYAPSLRIISALEVVLGINTVTGYVFLNKFCSRETILQLYGKVKVNK